MGKRERVEDPEVFEMFAALLRQSATRAVDRLQLQRAQFVAAAGNARPGGNQSATSASTRPIDMLVIQYAMYYLPLENFPSRHYIRLAQEIVTSSAERVFLPRLFAKVTSLPMLCEALVAENTADVIQATMKEAEAFVEARELLADWIAEYDGTMDLADVIKQEDDDDDDGMGEEDRYSLHADDEAAAAVVLDMAGSLYRSTEYWLRIQNFLNALSLSSAKMNSFPLRPRYERDLMSILHTLSSSGQALPTNEASRRASPLAETAVADGEKPWVSEETSGIAVKTEPEDATGEGLSIPAASVIPSSVVYTNDEDALADDAEETMAEAAGGTAAPQTELAVAVLADTLALSHCPTPASPSCGVKCSVVLSDAVVQQVRAVDPLFYTMVHARLSVMVSRDVLKQFSGAMSVLPPDLTVQQRQLLAEHQAAHQQRPVMSGGAEGALGVPLDFVPDDFYFNRMLEQQQDTIGEDEELYRDEVVDYYLHSSTNNGQRGRGVDARGFARGANARQPRGAGVLPDRGEQELIKPHRFCKVKTGFTWTQYNRTHYDSRTNPPPRTVLWYEFTLFYPALANTKRDMRSIFHIEDTPRGPSDDYCLLVFSVGPPYADVAYRIVKKQWDPRRGGVRISFDATGRYKLFFRFTNSNYRR